MFLMTNVYRSYRLISERSVFCWITDISGVTRLSDVREIFSIRIFFEAKKYSSVRMTRVQQRRCFVRRRISRWYCRYGCHGDRHRDNSLVAVAKNPKSLNYQEPLSWLIKFRQSFHSDGFHGTGEERGAREGWLLKGGNLANVMGF